MTPDLTPPVGEWRAFARRRYRPFRLVAVAQGFIGPLSGPAIMIPLLLSLGAHPALATILAVLPVLGTMGQRLLPNLLDRTDGNLRGLVVVGATIAEPRGLLLAGIVALHAMGIASSAVTIALVALVVGIFGSIGAIAYGSLQSWYQIILPDAERRIVGPRLAGIALGIGSIVLLPLAIGMDDLVRGIGTWAYAVPFGVSGVAGLIPAVALRRIPSPGRVRVPRQASWAKSEDDRLRGLARVLTLASLAAGLAPFLTVYAIAVLGTGPGFAIALSAISSGTLVLASLVVSSRLARGSASRMLRGSMLLRGVALLLGLAAHPANPYAPAVLVVIAVAMAAGDTAGQLSANERLFRLTTGPEVIAFQSHFVVRYVLAYGGGLLSGSAVMLMGGYPAFAILFGGAGLVRLTASRLTGAPSRSHVGTTTEVHRTVQLPPAEPPSEPPR